MNALGTLTGHNDGSNVHELWEIVRGMKNKTAVGNDGIPSEVYKFSSERLLTMMSISFPVVCMLTGKLPSTLMHAFVFVILYFGNFLNSCGCLTAKSKTPPQETTFLPTYRYRAWVPTIPDHS